MARLKELQNLSPVAVRDQLLRRWTMLIDVREPEEYGSERFPGALRSRSPHAHRGHRATDAYELI